MHGRAARVDHVSGDRPLALHDELDLAARVRRVDAQRRGVGVARCRGVDLPRARREAAELEAPVRLAIAAADARSAGEGEG